jgi:hypothetical protein
MSLTTRGIAATAALSSIAGFLGGLLSVGLIFLTLGPRVRMMQVPVTSAQAVNTVIARQFVLVDSQGRIRATLENTHDGAELVLTSPHTKTVARLDVNDPRTTTSEWSHSFPLWFEAGSASLWLHVPHGKEQLFGPSVSVSADSQGEVGFDLEGAKTGRIIARAYDLGTTLELSAPASATPYSGAKVTVLGERSRVTLAGDAVNIADNNGNSRATLGAAELVRKAMDITERSTLSSLTLFNEQGRVTWQAP